jgi:hypothetical protein
MKLKSLVIAHHNGAVNTFSDLVHTARHTMRAVCTQSHLSQPEKEADAKGMYGDWGEVVTR